MQQQALEGGSDSESHGEGAARPQTYNQEQQDVKNAFLEVHSASRLVCRHLALAASNSM